MATPRAWLGASRRLILSFVLVLLVPAVVVVWLGVRLVEQDRALASSELRADQSRRTTHTSPVPALRLLKDLPADFVLHYADALETSPSQVIPCWKRTADPNSSFNCSSSRNWPVIRSPSR